MQHNHRTKHRGYPVIVAMRFDKVRQGYVMTIQPIAPDNPNADKHNGMIYNSHYDLNMGDKGVTEDLGYYQEKLKAMEIEVPEVYIQRVLTEH